MRLIKSAFIGTLLTASVCAPLHAQPSLTSRIQVVDSTPYQRVTAQQAVYQHNDAEFIRTSGNSATGFYFSDYIDDIPLSADGNSFDCVGGIYAVLKFPRDNHELRNLSMVTKWYNPSGTLELVDERAQYAERGNSAYRWGGMILKRPQGGGLFSLLDPSAGMERFIGEWRVVITLGGFQLSEKRVRVQC